MPHPLFIFSQSDYLIKIADINSQTEWLTVQIQISWLLRSQLIWIHTVCKCMIYPGSAGQGLIMRRSSKQIFKMAAKAAILYFLAIFDLQVALIVPNKFAVNWPFSLGEKSGHGGHVLYFIKMIFTIYNLQAPPLLPTKFQID